ALPDTYCSNIGPVMQKISVRRLFQTALAVLLAFGATTAAQADNVPGSAKEATGYITAAGTDTLVNGIQGDVRKLRTDDRQDTGYFLDPQVTTENGMMKSLLAQGMVSGEGGLSMIGALAYRNIHDAGALDYDLYVGSLLLGYHLNDQTLVFGGLTGETGDGTTPPDDGTISHSAFGAVIGIDYALNDQMFLTFMAGKMALDYDITRSGGAVSASFGADRTYVNFSGEYRLASAGSTTVFTTGLRYVEQSDDAYTENGGGAVAAATGRTVSALFGTRTTFESASSFKPFIETDLRYDLSQDMVPYVVDHLPDGKITDLVSITIPALALACRARSEHRRLRRALAATSAKTVLTVSMQNCA
ncbi:MAG: autotransporter domain-containing protein, partial [Deltaproteobacteria bacterium]